MSVVKVEQVKSIFTKLGIPEITKDLMQEFQKNQETSSSQDSFNQPQENLFNY